MLQRWNPMIEFTRLFSEMDRLSNGLMDGGRLSPVVETRFDLYDTGDNLVLKALVPGVSPEHLDVSVEQGILTITGRFGYEPDQNQHVTWYRREIYSGQFSRSIQLPFPVDVDAADAHFEHGVLTLTLPKAEQARAKKIQIGTPQALSATNS